MQVRIEGLGVVLRDAVLDDLDALAFWLQSGQRWRDLDGPLLRRTHARGHRAHDLTAPGANRGA